MPLTAQDILDAMRVPTGLAPPWNVFQLGCVSTPLNFASQQRRAFKLTWALDHAGLLKGKQIAVVGAGLAGITAGLVGLLRGAARVSLYDRTHELMPYQDGAVHRYVHPMIFRWPEENAEQEATDFPILNWKENTADAIRRVVLEQAETLLEACYGARGADRNAKLFQHRVGCDVRHVVPSSDGRVQLLAEGQQSTEVKARRQYLPVGPIRNYQASYDVVIAAVGYGLEAEFPGLSFRSYWHLDTLSQPTIRGHWPKRWLVSGTGDGGLIDAVRLRLFDLDQRRLTTVLTGGRPEIPGVDFPTNWPEIIRELRRSLLEMANRFRSGEPDPRSKDEISRAIQQEFVAIDTALPDAFATLKTFLESRERTDTLVYLHGQQEMPYELGASLFQRFLIYLLRRHCGLRYRRGKLRQLPGSGYGGSYRFAFDRELVEGVRMPTEHLEVDEVVIRHGAESALGGLFGPVSAKSAAMDERRRNFERDLWSEPLDPTWFEAVKTPIRPDGLP